MESTKILKYTAMFEKAPEGGYVGYVPLLPGCMTQGDTFEEVKENIKDAISGYLEVLREDGDEVPLEQEERIAATVTVSALMNA
jgi:predicted RNase H-like HicB family nuclease